MCAIRNSLLILCSLLIATPTMATTPSIWKDPIANGHTLLLGNGQGEQTVNQALGFTFPYEGGGSTSTITIGTNGGIALANNESLSSSNWESKSFEPGFSAEGTARILAFSSGLSHAFDTTLDVEGVYFLSNSTEAYITWYRIAGVAGQGAGRHGEFQDHCFAPGLEYAVHLSQAGLQILKVAYPEGARGDIEGAIGKRQSQGVGLHP